MTAPTTSTPESGGMPEVPGFTFSPSAGPSQAGGSVSPTVTLGGPINVGSSSREGGSSMVVYLGFALAAFWLWRRFK